MTPTQPSHILVVDDQDAIRDLLARQLRVQGYQVATAENGREAIARMQKQSFDLVLLDLMMPGMSGETVLVQLKQDTALRHVPVVVISADHELSNVARCIENGADDYLFKPFNNILLRARVHACLERKHLRDREQSYLRTRLRALSTQPAEVTTDPGHAGDIDSTLAALLDELDQAQQARHRAEADLRTLNTTLEQRVAERSAEAEQRAAALAESELALRRQTVVLQSILNSIGDAVIVVDSTGELLHVNPASLQFFGGGLVTVVSGVPLGQGRLLLSDQSTPCPPDDLPLAQALRGESIDNLELCWSPDNGTPDRWISVTARPLRGAPGIVAGAVAVFRDVTSARQVAAALQASEERYALAARATNDGLWDWDILRERVFFSTRWKVMLGYHDHEISDDPNEWFGRIHPDDREGVQVRLAAHLKRLLNAFEHEYRIAHRDGAYRWMIGRGIAVWNGDGQAIRMVGSQADITERKRAEQQLLHDALHDSLTSLANRALFLDRLSRALAQSRNPNTSPFAILFLDLDRFKVINDSLGHLIGDELLITVARRLESCLRSEDTVARLGGDEFAILLEHCTGVESAEQVAGRILQALTEPFHLGNHEVVTSASIGIALNTVVEYPRPDDLLRDADTAMYHAKLLGKARYAVFDPTMHVQALARLRIETDLRRALDQHELRVRYQPIVALATGHLVGFEALLRWEHPHRGVVGPGEFIAIAEETGLIIPIGQWVLATACQQMRDWQIRFPHDPPLTISVNLSPRQLAQPDLVEQVAIVLDETGLAPQSLKLEITESTIISQGDDSTGVLQRLRLLGVQLCIDDFGTGYSSLSYLHRFPIDIIKIDRSFISQMVASSENLEIVRTIVALARSLGMLAIAEGAETDAQLSSLRALACDYGQGWLFARALDPDVAADMVAEASLRQGNGTPPVVSDQRVTVSVAG